MTDLPLLDKRDIRVFEKNCLAQIIMVKENGTYQSHHRLKQHVDTIRKTIAKYYGENIIGILPSQIYQEGGEYLDYHDFSNFLLVFSDKHIMEINIDPYERFEAKIFNNIDILSGQTFKLRYTSVKGEDKKHFWFTSSDEKFRFRIKSDNQLYTPKKLESLLLNKITCCLSRTKFFPWKVDFELKMDEKEIVEKVLTFPNSGHKGILNRFGINPINYERTNPSLVERLFKHFKVPASGGQSTHNYFISTRDKYEYTTNIGNVYDSIVQTKQN